MIDLARALYSHCDHSEGRAPHIDAIVDVLACATVGAQIAPTRRATFLQGATSLLDHPYEFRLHVWFDLPDGHPRFPLAARGLFCLVSPIVAEGLRGATYAGVGWLERRLTEPVAPEPGDWIAEMIHTDGFDAIDGAEWLDPIRDPMAEQIFAFYLARHLEGMVNHVILEERLYGSG